MENKEGNPENLYKQNVWETHEKRKEISPSVAKKKKKLRTKGTLWGMIFCSCNSWGSVFVMDVDRIYKLLWSQYESCNDIVTLTGATGTPRAGHQFGMRSYCNRRYSELPGQAH